MRNDIIAGDGRVKFTIEHIFVLFLFFQALYDPFSCLSVFPVLVHQKEWKLITLYLICNLYDPMEVGVVFIFFSNYCEQ